MATKQFKMTLALAPLESRVRLAGDIRLRHNFVASADIDKEDFVSAADVKKVLGEWLVGHQAEGVPSMFDDIHDGGQTTPRRLTVRAEAYRRT